MSKIELINYYLNLFKVSLIRFYNNLINFGIKVAVINFLGELSQFYLINDHKCSIYIRNKQRQIINDTLVDKYQDLINKYKFKQIKIGNYSKIIWCFWAQGIENAPTIVKNCVQSIKDNCGDYEVIILTNDNYTDYVDLPEAIINKLNDKTITITHFSDILRVKLLNTYGGIWVDATMFFSENVFYEFDDAIFNSRFSDYVQWSFYFMGGRPNKLFSFVYDFLVMYNIEYDVLINYFLMDSAMKIAYDNFDECKTYIDNVTLYQPNVLYFIERFSKPFNEDEFNEMFNKYKFFKLSYKNSKNSKYYDKNGQLTYFGYFSKKYKC